MKKILLFLILLTGINLYGQDLTKKNLSIIVDTLNAVKTRADLKADTVDQSFTGTIGLPTTTEYNGVRMDSVFVPYAGANQSVNLGSESLTTGGAITTTGMLTTGILKVSTTTNSVSLDSLTTDGDDVKFYDGADTLNPYIPYGFREIGIAASDTSVMLDPYAPLLSPGLLGTPTAPTAAGGTNTTQIATTAFVQTFNEIIRISFKIDSTLYAPETNDSLYTDSRLIGKDVKVYRGDATASLGRLYEQSWVDNTNVGYEFDDTDGKITFHPKFTTGEKVIIEASDTNKYTTGIDPYYLLRSDEYATVYDAMATPPTGDTIFWQDDMIYSLDSLLAWDRMRYFVMFAQGNSSDALINWVSPGTNDPTLVNAPTFTVWEGFTGVDNDYINTHYNPAVDSTTSFRDDVTFGIYVRTDQATSNNNYVIGSTAGSGYTITFVPRKADDTFSSNIHAGASYQTGASADGDGLWINTRRLRTGTGAIELYRNGTVDGDSETDASLGVMIADIALLYQGSGPYYGTNQISLFFLMDKITEDEDATLVPAINTIIERYMDRLGKGVQ